MEPIGRRLITGLVACKVLLHLAIVTRYGYHGDELYFIECSKRLAWGYADHPPLVVWLAWLATPFDHAIAALRLPSILAGGATMYLTLRLVREWGGKTWALLFAGLGILFAPVYLRIHTMLDIPAIELFIWTAASYGVARIHAGASAKHWLTVGAIAGVGLLTKYSMGLWGVGLIIGLLATDMRRHLRTPWPWLGGLLALGIAAGHFVWLAGHDWATLEFVGNMRVMLDAIISEPLFVAGQVLYMHPLSIPIWTFGLWCLFRHEGMPRVLGWIWMVAFVALIGIGGKPYYLACAYPALFAAGGVGLERAWADRPRLRAGYLGTMIATGIGLALCVLPILPIQTIDRAAEVMFGWAVPSQALTHDLHAELDWREHAESVREVYDALPAADQERSTLLAGNYATASAVRFYAPDLPPTTSGHLTYWIWGPEPGDVVIAWGMSEDWLGEHFSECERAGHIHARLARPYDRDLPIHVCRGAPSDHWEDLRNYAHSGAHPSVRTDTSVLRDESDITE